MHLLFSFLVVIMSYFEISWFKLQFYKNISVGLKDIVWKTIDEEEEEEQAATNG